MTIKDKIRNDPIGQDLNIEPIFNLIEKRQLGWWRHLQRLDGNSQVRKVREPKSWMKRKTQREIERTEWLEKTWHIEGKHRKKLRKQTKNTSLDPSGYMGIILIKI